MDKTYARMKTAARMTVSTVVPRWSSAGHGGRAAGEGREDSSGTAAKSTCPDAGACSWRWHCCLRVGSGSSTRSSGGSSSPAPPPTVAGGLAPQDLVRAQAVLVKRIYHE